MRGSCWQVSQPGKVAARWEYRNNPVVDLEKVRAFTMRYVCTLPSEAARVVVGLAMAWRGQAGYVG